jgi:amidase
MTDKKLKNHDMKHCSPDLARRHLVMGLAGGVAVSQTALSWGEASLPDESIRKDTALHYSSLLAVAGEIKSGNLLPSELTELQLDRIAAIDGTLHAYVTVMADQAMQSARRADAEIAAGHYRGPLHGVPIGIKDLCFTRGVRTMAGTKVLADFIPDFDATVVARLQAAGAVTLGKLTLCEGAHYPYHPELEVPVNPWNAAYWSGVSSSGSGVATAAGLCFGSIGTDTGGSIRYPSAVNGCVGLKPTYGRVSRYGVFALAESMDHVGPMTRTVADAAVMLEVMAGYDPNDPTSSSEPVPDIQTELGQGVAGLRIGIDRRYSSEGVDAEVARTIVDVVTELQGQGAQIVEVEMPYLDDYGQTWYDIETVEALIANEKTFPNRADEYGPGFRTALEYGQSVSATTYALAMRKRAEFSARLHRMLAGIDCFICPSMGNATRTKSPEPTVASYEDWVRLVPNDVFTKPFNFAGVPTLSVPCGFSGEGLPLSVQFVASRLDEGMLCRVGYAYEQATPWHKKHPPV